MSVGLPVNCFICHAIIGAVLHKNLRRNNDHQISGLHRYCIGLSVLSTYLYLLVSISIFLLASFVVFQYCIFDFMRILLFCPFYILPLALFILFSYRSSLLFVLTSLSSFRLFFVFGSFFASFINTVVPGCNVNGYNGHPHITDKILGSRIFSGFCNVNFPLYNSP